jgi:glycerol-3-phosphate dehydrogenase (NAD(P)+)
MSHSLQRIGVLGAGAWGTALATVAARAGHRPVLWSRSPEFAAILNGARIHPKFPGAVLPQSILAVSDPRDLTGCDLLIIATPAQELRTVLALYPVMANAHLSVVIAAKGIEIATGKFMAEVLEEVWPLADPYMLSGPSFAADVMANQPTAVTLAGNSLDRATQLAALLSLPAFRIYSSNDLLGVQLGGAIKNVLAIACGISEGKGFGDSARAALTTRGFSEMLRFGEAIGARRSTLTGLSGLGDLILTCSSRQSRNFSFGLALGRNGSAPSRPSQSGGTIEGVPTAKAIVALAAKRSLDLPVCEAVNAILNCRITVDEAIGRLLARPLRAE